MRFIQFAPYHTPINLEHVVYFTKDSTPSGSVERPTILFQFNDCYEEWMYDNNEQRDSDYNILIQTFVNLTS